MDEQNTPHGGISVIEALWRYRFTSLALVVAVAGLCTLAGFLSTGGVYAVASFGLKDPRGGAIAGQTAASSDVQSRYATDQAAFTVSDDVLELAADVIGGAEVSDLRGRVSAASDAEANVVRVTATADTTAEAKSLADAVVAGFREATQTQVDEQTTAAREALAATRTEAITQARTPQERAALSEQLADIDRQMNSISLYASTYDDGVRYVNPATVGSEPLLSQPWLRGGILGFGLGLLVASIAAVLRLSSATRRSHMGALRSAA